ncbi:MAG: LysR family transcriptional regulator [Myxococcaceae bacterium]|nr:MAG: LysR family transcriptional regulator [Myxococcaceae bacterium]
MKRVHTGPPLGQLDLNLLRVFDVVHREGSLSRAAEVLSLTQSAVSHAVARLRRELDDPLFVREGSQMVATPLATRLAPAIRDALTALERALSGRRAFDPAVDLDRLTVAIPDELEAVVLPALRSRVTTAAPGLLVAGVRFDLERLQLELATRSVDVAVGVLHPGGPDVRRERLIDDALCVVARKRYRRLDSRKYLAAGHVAVSPRRDGPSIEDTALEQASLRRRVVARCQRYETALRIVAESDLILTAPRHFADRLASVLGLHVLRTPVPLPAAQVDLYWHRRSEDDPANRWIRAQVRQVFRDGV